MRDVLPWFLGPGCERPGLEGLREGEPDADLRGRPDGDATDVDIQDSLDRTATVFGSKLEAPHPFVIKRTRHEFPHGRRLPPVIVIEYYTGMARTDRNWASERPAWSRYLPNAVGFATREDARHAIDTLRLKPRAEVVQREEVRK